MCLTHLSRAGGDRLDFVFLKYFLMVRVKWCYKLTESSCAKITSLMHCYRIGSPLIHTRCMHVQLDMPNTSPIALTSCQVPQTGT